MTSQPHAVFHIDDNVINNDAAGVVGTVNYKPLIRDDAEAFSNTKMDLSTGESYNSKP